MHHEKEDLGLFFSQIPNGHHYWGLFLAIGILLIILGGVAIGFAHFATEVSVILLGFLLAGGGLLQISSGFYSKKWSGFSLSLGLGLFYMIAGMLCIFKPMESALSISLLMIALLLVGGLFRIISAIRYRFNHWKWMGFTGLISILLGIFILAEWPVSAIWVIALFVGIDLILMGCYWVRLSLLIKK